MEEKIYIHIPVLVHEVVEYLNPQPHKTYLDVTFGGGGHTRAILEKEPTCSVIAMDWDQEALELNGSKLQEEFPSRLQLIWGNFALLYKILKKEGIDGVDGILADFGTSQFQIKEKEGFSFMNDTPLDMRMSPAHQKITAAEIINKASDEKLRQLMWQLGEERYAKEIVRAIVDERKKKEIKTTGQLAGIIERVVPHRAHGIHPATRVFQALRIYVNHELENIQAFLPAAISVLNLHGRLVVISFHSLEDRMVKHFFKEVEHKGKVKILTQNPITASDEEIRRNPSSRSAKLRAVEIEKK